MEALIRMFDFFLYLTALYNLVVIVWGEDEFFQLAATVCFCVCLFQLIRMAKYLFISNRAIQFNKADMVVISDDVVPMPTVAKGHRDGVYYMHSGRKEET